MLHSSIAKGAEGKSRHNLATRWNKNCSRLADQGAYFPWASAMLLMALQYKSDISFAELMQLHMVTMWPLSNQWFDGPLKQHIRVSTELHMLHFNDATCNRRNSLVPFFAVLITLPIFSSHCWTVSKHGKYAPWSAKLEQFYTVSACFESLSSLCSTDRQSVGAHNVTII